MRTFQALVFLTLLFATALGDPHGSVGGDVEEREIVCSYCDVKFAIRADSNPLSWLELGPA